MKATASSAPSPTCMRCQGHIVAGWDMPAYSYGQVMLGGPPSDPFT